MMSGRRPDWDLDSTLGQMGEETARILRESAVMGTAEVKTDRVALGTNRFYVETECLCADGQWHPSGVYESRADSYWFIPAPGAFALVFDIRVLRWLVAHKGLRRECTNGSHPTRGITISWATLLRDLDEHRGQQ